VVSDGAWYDTQAGFERIRALRGHGVPTIHISIGAEPLSVDADRIVVISDPAEALDQIAADTVAGQRRLLAAKASHALDGVAPIRA
jgi:hypothetical protein